MSNFTVMNINDIERDDQLWDYIAYNLVKQGDRSENDEGCVYRNEDNGLKCAVGWVIRNDYYDENFEGSSVISNQVMFAVSKSLNYTMEDSTTAMLVTAALIHDNFEPNTWPYLYSESYVNLFLGSSRFGPNIYWARHLATDYFNNLLSPVSVNLRYGYGIDSHKGMRYYDVNPSLSDTWYASSINNTNATA
jgi:hypothetical protein